MKPKFFFVLFFVLGITLTNAQNSDLGSQIVTKGNKIVNLGVGFGASYYRGVGYKMGIPPISVSGEYVIKAGLINSKAAIGAGLYIGFGTHIYENSYADPYGTWEYKYTYTDIFVGPRGFFHYQFVKKLDTYAGVFIGFHSQSEKYTETATGIYTTYHDNSYTPQGSGVGYSLFAGGRYFFTNNFAAMAEFGYGISYINIGLAFKF